MWRRSLLVITLLLAVNALKRDANLDAIKDRIQQSNGVISSATLGDANAWNYMSKGLSVGQSITNGFKFAQFSFDYNQKNNQTELIVSGTASLWGNDTASVTLVLYYSQGLAFYLQFDCELTQIPVTLIPNTGSGWFSGLSIVGDNKISIASQSFTDLNSTSYTKGLTIEAHVQTNENLPIQDSLGGLIHGGAARSKFSQQAPITGDIVATFPLSSGEPLAHVTFTVDGSIFFGTQSVKSQNLKLDIQVVSNAQPTATLSSDIVVSSFGNVNSQLDFLLTAQVNQQNGFTFNGNLQGSWDKAFGLNWLSFPNLGLTFDFNYNSKPMISTFTFQGGINFEFASFQSPITTTFSGELDKNLQDIVITTSIPIVDFGNFFNSVIGKNPSWSGQVSTTGQVSITVATGNSGGYQAGLTLNGNVQVAPSSAVGAAVKSIDESASTKSYQFNLYVPIFSQQPQNVDFTVSETGAIHIVASISLNGFTIKFTESPEDVQLSTGIIFQSADGASLTFDVSADIQVSSPSPNVNFQGNLQGTWNHPFGLSWLTLQDVQGSLVVNNGKIQSWTITGTVGISFGQSASDKLTVSLPGPEFTKYSFTLNVLVPQSSKMMSALLPNADVPSVTSEVAFTAALTISNYDHDTVKTGLAVQGTALIVPNGVIANAIKSISTTQSTSFSIDFFIPIYSNPPITGITFSLSAQGDFIITQSITLNGFSINFSINGKQSSVTLSSSATINLNHNPSPIIASISADLSKSDLSFIGSIQSNWSPFGLKWLDIDSSSVSIDFSNNQVSSFEIKGEAKVTIDVVTTVDIDLKTTNNFKDFSIELKAMTISSSLSNMIQKLSNINPPSEVGDIKSISNKIDIILSTYDDSSNGLSRGLTISDTVTISGDFLNKLKVFNSMNGVSSATFELGLNIPIFSDQSPDIKIFLQTSGVPLKSNMQLTGVKLELDTSPLSFSVSTGLIVTFKNNPQLEFDVIGSFSADQTIKLSGDMLGTWENMFGIKGLSLSDVDLAIGFNPAMCGVDFCISAFGLGLTLYIGTKEIAFYGYVDIPNVEDIFLEGSIKGDNGMALSLQDVVIEWNSLVGNELGIPLNPNSFPADWGIENTEFYIAPESGTFNQIQYQQGFWIDGGFRLFGLECDVDIKVVTGDFEFHVKITLTEFQNWLHKELTLLYQERGMQLEGKVVTVNNVTLSNLSIGQIAKGNDPEFFMDYNFLGHHQFTVKLPLVELYQGFHYFFVTYLKHLF